MSDLLKQFRYRVTTKDEAFVGVEVPPAMDEIDLAAETALPADAVGNFGMEEITLTRCVTDGDDLYAWMRDQCKPDAPPGPVDIECYQVPRPWLRRLWYRARMLLGRLVRRWYPRPECVFKNCVVTSYKIGYDPAMPETDVTVTYVLISREGA